MESNIVKDFQNLRVFSNRHTNRMDELVQDLSNALEETSKGCSRNACSQDSPLSSGLLTRRHHKRRRGARRVNTNLYWKRGTISEASESSVDEAGRDLLDNSIVTHSDSDDLALAYPKQRLMVPMTEPVPPVESDSFTENLSPMRPQRRRRRFKHMGVDTMQTVPQASGAGDGYVKSGCTPAVTQVTAGCTSDQRHGLSNVHNHIHPGSSLGGIQNVIPGKRKRSSKNQREVTTMDQMSCRDKNGIDGDDMEIASVSQESSSLSSSEFDSDVHNNADEGREADDEQSDFFHEPDACSGAEMTPWWDTEVEGLIEGDVAAGQEEFDQILSGAFSYMSTASRKKFRQRVDKLLARAESGREIRFGRRKLKGKMPRYTMMRFLQDQERWSSMQGTPPVGSQFSPGASWNSGYSSQSGDYKRLRQTPPPPLDLTEEATGVVGVDASPIPETNIGNRMLQSMGWTPGSGLGAEGDGCTNPVVAFRRRGRKGLGYETQSDT